MERSVQQGNSFDLGLIINLQMRKEELGLWFQRFRPWLLDTIASAEAEQGKGN